MPKAAKKRNRYGLTFTYSERTEKKYTVADAVRASVLHIAAAMEKANRNADPLDKALDSFVLPRLQALDGAWLGRAITLVDVNVLAVHIANETLNYYFDMEAD